MTTPWKGERGKLGSLDAGWRLWSNNLGQRPSGLRSPAPPSRFPKDNGRLHFLEYMGAELSWGKSLSWEGKRAQGDHIINFLRVPVQLEPFLSFGHAICADLFLFHFTYLPLRCLVAVGSAVLTALGLSKGYGQSSPRSLGSGSRPHFSRGHAYDLLKGAMILIAVWALGAVQVSRVYHYIRGEAIIKLYVIFNILEIFDKLACSLGQDVLDALNRTMRDHVSSFPGWRGNWIPRLSRLIFHFSIATIYVVAHSLILFVQVVCLNVAINSRNNALLTLLISNNFVELKASVFKRFEAENLFQVSCADIVERFQMSLFLALIALQEFSSLSMVYALLPSMVAIFLCEVVVDYLKHSFISKFNRLHADLYGTFSSILSHDIVTAKTKMERSLDPTHTSVKRLGLPTLPLVVVVCRIILLKVAPVAFPRFGFGYPLGVCASFVAILALFAAKSVLGMVLMVIAAHKLQAQKPTI